MATVEEIYANYGQYNRFVVIEFVPCSQSFQKYGPSIAGTFRYSLEERQKLEAAINNCPILHTEGIVRFRLSKLLSEPISDALITELDRDGFLTGDIEMVYSVPLDKENKFVVKGEKKIENIIPIQVDLTERENLELYLFLYQKLWKEGQVIHNWQFVEVAALVSYLHPEDVQDNIKTLCDNPKLKPAIRHKFLEYKKTVDGLSEKENDEYIYLKMCRAKTRFKIAQKVVQKSGILYKSLPSYIKDEYFKLIMNFETKPISMGNPIIWIDFERAFHIISRHVKSLQPQGGFRDKTVIQYHYKDLFQLIHMVIESQGDEIQEELRSGKNVRRMGTRAIEYNGNYYRLEIESNGRILVFHPLN